MVPERLHRHGLPAHADSYRSGHKDLVGWADSLPVRFRIVYATKRVGWVLNPRTPQPVKPHLTPYTLPTTAAESQNLILHTAVKCQELTQKDALGVPLSK